MLTENDDPLSEVKGYLLCDIYITGKDSAKIVNDCPDVTNDIERLVVKVLVFLIKP